MEIGAIDIDLGKTTFHLVALGEAGKVLVRKKFTQRQLIVFTENRSASLIGLGACSGAHFLMPGPDCTCPRRRLLLPRSQPFQAELHTSGGIWRTPGDGPSDSVVASSLCHSFQLLSDTSSILRWLLRPAP
jgi:hypothetical protein